MDGIKPKQPLITDVQPEPSVPSPQPDTSVPVNNSENVPEGTPPKVQDEPKQRKKWPWIVLGVLLFIVAMAVGVYMWYKVSLSPVEPGSNQLVSVNVKPGTDAAGLADLLKQKDVIRSSQAFQWYVKMQGVSNKLQAGPYKLSRGSSVPTIVSTITSGKTDTFSLTFLPGDTLSNHRKVLLQAGFSKEEVDAALAKKYNHPLFATKPASADLEGYIYGETYEFPANASVEDVLTRIFDQMYGVVKENNLVAAYKKHGLTLYQGITLASIIQREVASKADSAQVAQVFLLRLKKDMQLGSDVTYQYIADKTGQARDPNLDSPYNTRRFKGLPPGPISSPGKDALLAVANPAKGNYLFFLSGDDDKTYFAHTDQEHQKNIDEHCQKKCQIL